MKTSLLLAVIIIMATNLFPQRAITIYKKNGSGGLTILVSNIDSITFPNLVTSSPCLGIPTVAYAGKVYNTVQIVSQCWLKENLDVGTRIDGTVNQTNNGTIEKYCYNDAPTNCTTYGGLYKWYEAMQYVTTSGTKGICPTGWHIPTDAEFTTLSTTVNNNSNVLKAIGQGSGDGTGTNTSGFSALLAGRNYGGSFYYLGVEAIFWSSTENGPPYADDMDMFGNGSYFSFYRYNKEYGVSVRCIQD